MSVLLDWIDRKSLYLALLAAWVATLGSLYFSEVAGYVPCVLCWYQRILMYPLALMLAIGLLRRDPHLPVYVLPFSLAGLSIATYHYLLEKTDLFSHGTVCQAGVSCVTAWINWFGFITIPLLSLVGFLIITVMTAIALNAGEPDPEEDAAPPWLPVTGIAAATLIAFGLLALINRQPATAASPFPVGDSSAAGAQSLASTTALPEHLAVGARFYGEACASCHGAAGEGVPNLGTPLVDAPLIQTSSDSELLGLIRRGRAADDPENQTGLAMPPSGGRPDLTDREILEIIHYLRMGL
jgi:disulfide bond formation protein DsbB/cytochrome c5